MVTSRLAFCDVAMQHIAASHQIASMTSAAQPCVLRVARTESSPIGCHGELMNRAVVITACGHGFVRQRFPALSRRDVG